MIVLTNNFAGTIYGESITRMQEDNLKLVIDETLKKFHPLVHPTNYRQVFVPHSFYSF